MDQAISFLVQNCGIDRLSLLPTNNVLIPLVAFFDKAGGAAIDSPQIRTLQRWVYLALIWSRYSSTVETKLDQDVAALSKEEPVENMIRNIEDQVGSGRKVTERELQDQRKNSPYMLMSYILARNAGAADWFNGVKIGPNQPLEYHHIFPKGILREHYDLRADSRTVDQVANLAFLSKRANTKISSSSPAAYLPQIDESRLRSQHVPMKADLWSLDRFEDFMLERRMLLATEINKLLSSLSDKPSLWPVSDVAVLETRVDSIELGLRELTDARLTESWGTSAWAHCIPKQIRQALENRIQKRLEKAPFEEGLYETLSARLKLAQFSDYPKIVEGNWSIFDDVFGSERAFDQHVRAVTEARNAIKHNRSLSGADMASAEAGLLWLEDCLRHANELLEEEDVEELQEEDLLVTVP
jgi:hypothetical protein